MKWTILIFLAGLIPFSGCNKNECKGQPGSIEANENLLFIIRNQTGENIFTSLYSSDSLKIFENNDTVGFEVENDNSINFVSSISNFDTVENYFGKSLQTTIFFELKNDDTDTLTITTNPVFEEKCGAIYYTHILVKYNQLVNEEFDGKRGCISCGESIVLTKK